MPKENSAIHQESLPSNPEEYKLGLTEVLKYLKGNRKTLNFIISGHNGSPISLDIFDRNLSANESFFFAQVVERQQIKVSQLRIESPFHLIVANSRDIFEIANGILSHIRDHYPIAIDLPIQIYSSQDDFINERPILKITERGGLTRPGPSLPKPDRHYQRSFFDPLWQ